MRADLVDVLGGSFAASALLALHRSGMLADLAQPTTVDDLVVRGCADRVLLDGILTFLAQTTDVLERDGDQFQLSVGYRSYNALGFHLDKFLGAYGAVVAGMDGALAGQAGDRGRLVDREALAAAFAQRVVRPPTLTAEVLRTWTTGSLVDIGCGSGSLLIELAADETFRGWGIDASPAMVDAAHAHAEEAGVSDRLSFTVGDVRSLRSVLDSRVPPDAALFARSLMNEFFGRGAEGAVQVLRLLGEVCPGRLLLVEDYYGRLGVPSEVDVRHTVLQDLVQLASGQGVPPQDLAGWAEVYGSADVRLLHAYEGVDDGICWFLHVCVLP